ncbi:MAG: DNA alkylation repair protein [Butyrivibrio sp.]|nr:DNA alkylation repair protein [Butyrivibrio sp.]
MIIDEIREELHKHQDLKYRDLQIKILPSVKPDAIIGVRTPELRSYAKELAKRDDIHEFLKDLPHKYFDEDQLHAFILSGMKDYEKCIAETEVFLPYVNNWATTDQMSPKVFKRHRTELLKHVNKWIKSKKTYTIRFGIGMLMEHFLDEDFDIKYPETVAKIRSDEYYVNMMIAWYFATALAKQYDAVRPFIENKKLDTWTHNKAIQKSVESYRITPEQKTYLKTLKIKK